MTLREFAPLMAYLAAAAQKPAPAETVKVYFDLLNDIPVKVLEQAIRAAVVEHRYATIPPVATIREIASKIQGADHVMTAMESIAGARKLIGEAGGSHAGPEERSAAFAKMPPLVAACLRAFGWDNFCDSECRETLQAQWRMNWDAVAERQKRNAALPEDLRQLVDGRKQIAIPANMLRMPAE